MNEGNSATIDDLETGADVARDVQLDEHAQAGSPAPAVVPTTALDVAVLKLDEIAPDPEQARDEGADDELRASIATNGVQQPIVVRPHPHADAAHPWMIVDGERRYRGALAAGFLTIPARIDESAMSIGDRLLKQNLLNDGKRLKPMEEARSWRRIMEDKGWNLQQLATALGRAKSTVSDRLALLDAPAPFQKLFADGVLTPAAAPIVREYRDVPEKILKAAIKRATEDQWRDPIDAGVPVNLDLVRTELNYQLFENDDSELMSLDKSLAHYSGGTCTVRGTQYATDLDAYEKALDARDGAKKKGNTAPTAPTERTPDPYAAKQRAEAKKARAKSDLRGEQVRAIAAKLPSKLDASWARFLVAGIVQELSTDGQRFAVRILGIEPPKMGTRGFQFGKALIKHAESLNLEQLQRLALTLVMAPELYVSPYGGSDAKRIAEGARLAKVNLATVKPAVAERAAPKGKGAKRTTVATFMQPMQPDAALGAIVGTKPLPRTEVTKKLWSYIKKHGCQGNGADRRNIHADALLKPVLGGKKKLSMFEMTKEINKHLKPAKGV